MTNNPLFLLVTVFAFVIGATAEASFYFGKYMAHQNTTLFIAGVGKDIPKNNMGCVEITYPDCKGGRIGNTVCAVKRTP